MFGAGVFVYQGVDAGRSEGQANCEVSYNLYDFSKHLCQTWCGILTATWYVCSDSVMIAMGTPTTQKSMYTMVHQAKFGKFPRMSAMRDETKVISHANYTAQCQWPAHLFSRITQHTIAMEVVARAKGSPTRLLMLNLRPLPALYLLFSILRSDGELVDPCGGIKMCEPRALNERTAQQRARGMVCL